MHSPLAILQAACKGASLCCHPRFWAVIVVVSLLWIAALGLAVALARAVWLGAQVHRALSRIPRGLPPPELAQAVERVAITRV